jgi:hypothetical protein
MSWKETKMTDYKKSDELVEVPSPFGVYKDGEKVVHIGTSTVQTSWPGFVDPITGFTLELAVDEQAGMKIESDEELMEFLDRIETAGDDRLIERLIEYARDATAEYIVELLMNKEER